MFLGLVMAALEKAVGDAKNARARYGVTRGGSTALTSLAVAR